MASSYYVRLVMELELEKESKWFADKEAVGKLIDLVTGTDLGAIFTHAGVEDEEKPAKGAAAIRKAMATGKDRRVSAIDAADNDSASSKLALRMDETSLRYTVRVGGAALAARKATVLDSLDQVAQGLLAALRKRGGLSNGRILVESDDDDLVYPRPRPPIEVDWGPMEQLVQYVDVRYHNDPDYGGTHPDEVNAVAKAAVPAGVKRTEKDELITLRWLDSMADPAEVGRALGRYGAWIAKVLPAEIQPGFNALGDREDDPSDRSKKAPFTFWDKDENVAYKAIMVSPDGEVDDDLWAELQQALKAGAKSKLKVRLIVPLRELALTLRARAYKAGFDAVLYPDDRKRFWNPDPPGEWVEDIKPTPTSADESAKKSKRKKG